MDKNMSALLDENACTAQALSGLPDAVQLQITRSLAKKTDE